MLVGLCAILANLASTEARTWIENEFKKEQVESKKSGDWILNTGFGILPPSQKSLLKFRFSIPKDLGIPRVLAEVLAEQKAAEIRKLQTEGKREAIVGDDINDVPAIAQSDLGIAIETGTDITIETAQITLMRRDARGLINTIKLNQATMRTLHQNSFLAFAYNVMLIPITAGIFFPIFQSMSGVPIGIQWLFGKKEFLQPILAAGAMAVSSGSVVTHSLRLKTISLD